MTASKSVSLPQTWNTCRIGDLGATEFAKVNPLSSPNEQFEYYSIPAYQNGKTAELTRGRDVLSQKTVVPSRCVLFGKLNPSVEKVWNVKSSGPFPCIASTEWLPIVPNEGIDQDWLYFLMYSQWVMPLAKTLVTGSTPSRQRVDPRSFYEITVPVPEMREQQAIARILTLVEITIRHQIEKFELLGTLKRAAMRALFTRGLRGEAQKETAIGPMPESWDPIAVGSIATVKGGKRMPKGISLTNENTGQPYLRVTDFNNHGVNVEEVLCVPNDYQAAISRYVISSDDIYISIAGTIGLVGQVPKVLDGANLTENAAKLSVSDWKVTPRFLMYALASDTCQAQIAQSTATNAQPKLALVRIEQIQLPIPPKLDEQREIVAILDAIDRKIDLHRRKRAVLEGLFTALLHKLMTGEIRVENLEPTALTTSLVSPLPVNKGGDTINEKGRIK